MEVKKAAIGQKLVLAGSLVLAVTAFLIAMQSYFNHQEISTASNSCLEQGGTPTVKATFLALNYFFDCEGT